MGHTNLHYMKEITHRCSSVQAVCLQSIFDFGIVKQTIRNMTDDLSLLKDDVPLEDLSDLFCRNQRAFYLHIVKNTSSQSEAEADVDKPLRLHRVEGLINCVFSPKKAWSFYNAILDTDICQILQDHQAIDTNDHVLTSIISLATRYQCPVRAAVQPNVLNTIHLLKSHGFFEIPTKPDVYQYVDFYDATNFSEPMPLDPDVRVYELDDATQSDCQQRKAEWGYVMCECFGFPDQKTYGPFFSKVWSQVTVGPGQPIRMFVAVSGDRVVGGSHASLAAGVACLFNVTTLKHLRGKGVGKALSVAAMQCAKDAGYRFIILQASDMGAVIYKKLGYKPLPGNTMFVKIGTIAWYFQIVERLVRLVGLRRLQQWRTTLQKLPKAYLFVGLISIVVLVPVLFFSRLRST